MNSIGVDTFTKAIHEICQQFGMVEADLYVECFQMPNEPRVKVRVGSPHFKTAEDYVDEAWEENR